MSHPETAISRFFQSYAQKSNEDNIPAIVSRFADRFVSANPNGTHCVRAAEFAAALPKRKLLFGRLGCIPARLVNLQETRLDERYFLAKTTWRFDFASSNAPETKHILVDSTFLVDTGGQEFKIVMYMAHQDIMQVLRDRGILPLV
jgi:hypothetical protein